MGAGYLPTLITRLCVGVSDTRDKVLIVSRCHIGHLTCCIESVVDILWGLGSRLLCLCGGCSIGLLTHSERITISVQLRSATPLASCLSFSDIAPTRTEVSKRLWKCLTCYADLFLTGALSPAQFIPAHFMGIRKEKPTDHHLHKMELIN